VPQDMIAVGNKLAFEAKENALALIPSQSEALILHPHALRQVAEKAKVRNFASFVTELKGRGQWGAELIAENLNRIYSHMNGDRYLVRQVRGEVRGFLSDQYRRLDGHEMLDAFVGAMQQYGARPIDGFALQTKISVRCFLPMIFEPFPGEIVAVGAELTDSDYGDGFLTLNGILERMWCTNLATTTDVLKQVHLGKRLPQNIRLSDETYRLDTKAMASLINDLASNVLGPDAVNQYLAFIGGCLLTPQVPDGMPTPMGPTRIPRLILLVYGPVIATASLILYLRPTPLIFSLSAQSQAVVATVLVARAYQQTYQQTQTMDPQEIRRKMRRSA
jgi:hypothetical protein